MPKTKPSPPQKIELKYVAIGRVTSKSVEKHTGKNWDEWVEILNDLGAHVLTHQEIVALLKKKYKLTPWWQQEVTLGYEIAIERRLPGQTAKGLYTVTATKSLAIDAKKLWKLINSDQGIQIWLKPMFPVKIKVGEIFETTDGYYGQIRTLRKDTRIRLSWQDPNWSKKTSLQIFIVPNPKQRSILVFSHDQIDGIKNQELFRKRWKSVITELANTLNKDVSRKGTSPL